MADAHKNFAYSTVATAPSPASSGTSLVVAAADGTKFPAVPFNAVIWPANVSPTVANAEVVRVTNISTDTFTITRTQESSSARTVVVGDQITAPVTAKTLTDIETSIPVKATGAELDTGTDDAKFATSKAINDSHNVPDVVPSTAGNIMISDGTDWTSFSGSAAMSATQTINSGAANALVDITSLVFNMVSGATYWFEANIFYTVDVTTTGTRWTVNTTGGAPTFISYWSQYTLTASTWTYNMFNNAVQLPAASNATSVVAANVAIIAGSVKASANGTLIVQGAREVTTASTAIVVAAGSFLKWMRIS